MSELGSNKETKDETENSSILFKIVFNIKLPIARDPIVKKGGAQPA